VLPRPDLILLLVVTAATALVLTFRPDLTRERNGKILAFLGLVVLPAMSAWSGLDEHLERSKTRTFCLSCHVMKPYGKSLFVDDSEYIPAVHFQNNFVPPENACFTCHTTYALYGDLRAKISGLRHMFVYYAGSTPDTIHPYKPYNNRECLHCHGGARKFTKVDDHSETDTTMASLLSGRLSCLESGCHDVAHEVQSLNDVEFWKGAAR
jgi:nitrate/TMAO reductase-like tetraheme cytochrome c subunit